MKKFTFIAMVLLLGTSAMAQTNNYNVGDLVDDFTVIDTAGNEWSLYDLTAQGKYVYMDFFFDTCGPCQQTQATFNEFHDKYGCNEGNLFMISINNGSDSDAEVIAYEETFGGTFSHSPAVSSEGGGGAVTSNFGVNAFPTYCMVGPDNKLVERDIFPINNLGTFEATIPADSGAEPMACTLGLGEVSIIDFTMYPNPSNGSMLNLELPVAINEAEVTIYSTLGRVVFKTNLSSQLSTLETNLSAGAYLVNVTIENLSKTLMLTVR